MSSFVISIHGAGSEMQGVGRHSDGRAVFVHGALPGEKVEVRLTKEAPRYCEAQLMKVIEQSEHRIQPTCPHYGSCGGCAARHMDYAYTLSLKRQRVVDALTRIGGVQDPDVRETLGCAATDRCRNKAEYALSMHTNALRIGLRAGNSHEIIEIDDCLLQKEESVRALRFVRRELAGQRYAHHIKYLVTRVNKRGEMCVVFSSDAPIASELEALARRMKQALPELHSVFICKLNPRPTHALDGRCTCIIGEQVLSDELFDLRFELSPQSFFQVNPIQTERLYQCALDAVNAGRGMRLLDAYCGAGTISLAAASRGCEVLGVEIVPPAIENAKRNALINRLEPKGMGRSASGETRGSAHFICADATREIPRQIRNGANFDAAIIDPPRKGAEPPLLEALAAAAIPKIAYVSCNPSTLARDIKQLLAYNYHLIYAQPVDMFPWTEHVETVCLLAR